MRHIRKLLSLLFVCGLLLVACAPAMPQRPEQLSYPPLEFTIPDVERLELANGIRLYLKEDSELPLVQVTAMLGSGSMAVSRELSGFDELFAATLRTGGTVTIPAADLEERLDLLAANLGCGMGPYTTSLDLSIRRNDLEEGLTILADLLRRPAFAADKLELARSKAQEALRRRNDDPDEIASRLLMAALYPEHPLGDSPTKTSLYRIDRESLLAYHRQHFTPDNLWLAVSGDVTRDKLLPLLSALFDDWPRRGSAAPTLPPLQASSGGALQVIVKEIPQSTILLGDLGVTKDSPDQYPGRVLNFILGGGGFNSRLLQQIRSDRGLAYSAWSQFQVGRRYPGPIMAGTETKNATVIEALQLIQGAMKSLREQEVTAQELQVAKDSLVNSFVFSFADPHAVVAQRMQLDFFTYPSDYLARYRERIGEVTAADVQRVGRQYLHPERQQVVVVGTPDETGASLDTLGLPVRRLKAEELP